MTIAKRLIILLTVPLLALVGLGVFSRLQLAKIEARSRFVAESRIVALATLGNLSLSFAELRVNVRSYLLAADDAQRAAARAAFAEEEQDVTRLLRDYADNLVLNDKERRLLGEYQTLCRDWVAGAKQVMVLADEGRGGEAAAPLNARVADLGHRLSQVSSEWIAQTEQSATAAGQESIAVTQRVRRELLLAELAALLVTSLLGFLTFRRIVKPVRALEWSVKAIAAGDYREPVPFVLATDETGGLARSIDVLKQGAAAMDEQRWVKSNVSRLTGELQGAGSLAEFGQRLLSTLVPMLGGGVAAFYVFDDSAGELQRICRVRPCGTRRPGPPDPARRGAWSASVRRSGRRSRSRTCLQTTSASPRLWVRRHRSTPWRCQPCPRMRCWAFSKWLPSGRSTRRRSRCSTS